MIKGILFSTDMVRAILDNRKTATRRLPSKQIQDKWFEYDEWVKEVSFAGCSRSNEKEFYEAHPPYQPGDILYVRETWLKSDDKYYYRADFDSDYLDACETLSGGYPTYCRYHPDCDGCMAEPTRLSWRPSIHMPKEAARIWLKVVTDVRVERLRDISIPDLDREGFSRGHAVNETWYERGMEDFKHLWDSTIKKKDLPLYGWDANPYVWVIEFERIEKPKGENHELQ